MALTNYTDLCASVATWLHRSDLTAVIPDFISIAESRMSTDLQARDMDVTVSLATVAGTATVTAPTDIIETRRMLISSTDPTRVLTYVTPEQLKIKYPYSTIGTPEVFTVIGGNFEFAPVPDSAYTLSYTYRQRIPSLAANSTNWAMTRWPHVYLYGTLCAASPYLGQDQRIAVWEQAYQSAVQDVNSIDWYSGGGMVVRSI